MNNKPWYETKEGKQQLLDIVNEKFAFLPDGEMIPREEFCKECKKERVVCACVEEN
jgi:hypothetical protein